MPVGACPHSTMTCFSFHPVKTIAMGEGGAVTTNDPHLYERLKRLRNHGMTRNANEFRQVEQAFDPRGEPNPWYYEMPEPGFNYRASDINCALGLSQLRRLDDFARARRLSQLTMTGSSPSFPIAFARFRVFPIVTRSFIFTHC